MSKKWKTVVVLSLSLNLACFVAIVGLGEKLVDAQLENIGMFKQLSVDQQQLRRELNEAKAQFDGEPR